MKPKKPLTERGIQALKPAASGKRLLVWDAIVPGLGVRVTDQGARTFVLVTRYPGGRHPAPRSLGAYGAITLEAARIKAREWLKLSAEGRDPADIVEAKPETVAAILDEFMTRYVRAKGRTLRSANQIESAFNRHVKPRIGKLPIYALRRSQIVVMLNEIADEHGPVAADRTLAYLSKAFNWFAMGDDDFTSPIVRGMARVKPRERARERTLTDEEIRAVWLAADGQGTFGAFVQFVLLTATRRNEAARARRSEISGTDWLIPRTRYKTKTDHLIPLSTPAREVLAKGSQFVNCPWLFTTDGKAPVSGFSKFKRKFDEACGVGGWTLHDLRRTARSLMSRAGVAPDHAERCLGHVIGGVRGTYDRHAYAEEKRMAFEALAAQIDRIVNPRENVVGIGSGGRG